MKWPFIPPNTTDFVCPSTGLPIKECHPDNDDDIFYLKEDHLFLNSNYAPNTQSINSSYVANPMLSESTQETIENLFPDCEDRSEISDDENEVNLEFLPSGPSKFMFAKVR